MLQLFIWPWCMLVSTATRSWAKLFLRCGLRSLAPQQRSCSHDYADSMLADVSGHIVCIEYDAITGGFIDVYLNGTHAVAVREYQ